MSRILLSFVIGGATGVASCQVVNFTLKKKNNSENVHYNLQKKMASRWSNNYEPTLWDWNWDGLDQVYKDQEDAEKLEKGTDVENKRDINNNYINKDDNKKPATLAKATRHLLFIRHGQYNTEGKTDEEHTLTENGSKQATSTGKHLNLTNLPFTKLIVSSMTRAQQTADLIQTQLTSASFERSSTHLLREGAPFPPGPMISSWKPDHKQFLEDGIRIEDGFRSVMYRADMQQKEDSYEIVVCHANVIRYFVCRALQLPPEAWLRMSLQHASVTWLSIRPSGRVTLRCFGDGGHIPLPLKTFS